MESEGFEGGSLRAFYCMNRFLGTAISGTLTGLFALAGAFTGAVTGALAGRASDSGVLRGAGVGALAGAVLCVEFLEASRAYWCMEQSGSRSSSSMADFIEELFRRRFDDEQLSPGMPSSYHWQVDISVMSRHEMLDTYDELDSRGLSGDSLKKLPSYKILDEAKSEKTIYCAICLQDIIRGEMARSLPKCLHTFHLACVDKWLVRHSSCPICRQDV